MGVPRCRLVIILLYGPEGFLENLVPARNADEGAKRVPDLVIYKKFASAFFGTNLAAQLTLLGVDTLVVGGARTGGEIRQSVLDAQGLRFRSMVSSSHFLVEYEASRSDKMETDCCQRMHRHM